MKYIFTCLAIICTIALQAQSISGKATYESKTTVDMDGFGGREMTDDMKKMIMERMKSMLEKTYILTFNKNESLYTEEEHLETGASGGGMRMMMNSFSAGVQYKNTETNELVEENEFFGKQFLIKDTIQNINWTLTKESKQIGQYIAFKATGVKELSDTDFQFARRRGGRDGNRRGRNENDTEKKQDTIEDSKKDPLEEIEIPKEIEITAWYTPQIPTSTGPGEYGGLPGLILELNAHRTTILCSKIEMNTKDTSDIKKPTKGKEVSREEYQKIVKEKTEEMRANFRGGGRGGRRF